MLHYLPCVVLIKLPTFVVVYWTHWIFAQKKAQEIVTVSGKVLTKYSLTKMQLWPGIRERLLSCGKILAKTCPYLARMFIIYIYFRKYPAVRGTPINFEINSKKVLSLGCVGLSAETESVK